MPAPYSQCPTWEERRKARQEEGLEYGIIKELRKGIEELGSGGIQDFGEENIMFKVYSQKVVEKRISSKKYVDQLPLFHNNHLN